MTGPVRLPLHPHHSSLESLAEVNPVLRGWLNYFTVFYPSAVNPFPVPRDSV